MRKWFGSDVVREELNLLSFLSTNNSEVESSSMKRLNVKAMLEGSVEECGSPNAFAKVIPVSCFAARRIEAQGAEVT